jgi:ribonucleoside-diphosphate reductase alpha chain
MLVIKRDGSQAIFNSIEVLKDVEQFLTKNIDTSSLLAELEKGIVDKITTRQISDLLANICASRISKHPDYNKLASAICVVKLHKETSNSYSATVERLYRNDPKLVSDELYEVVMKHKEVLDSAIDYNRDFLFDFFGLKTLERSYLKKIHSKSLETSIFEAEEGNKNPIRKDALGHNNEELKYVHKSTIIERPQHLYMTVSLGIHGEDIEKAIESYNYMSKLLFTMATPTMYNSGTQRSQMSSCYILDMEDNIENIFKVIGDCGMLSKYSGGIGLCLSRIRSKKSTIRGTNGQASGIIPLCRVLNDVARYIDQGSKRNGSIAVYTEPWSDCIYSFLDMKKNTGDENLRCRDLFMGLWVPDLFMKRVQNDELWSLMCPDECKELVDSYGEEFEALYTKYESEGKYRRQVKAKDLWLHILEAQLETGVPYLCFKDQVNRKTNHQNIGVIKSSNLCSEIMEYYDKDNTAVCNLASVCLQRFIKFNEEEKPYYDYESLYNICRVIIRNLDTVIDKNFYPIPEAKKSNMSLRPVGLGCQGLANVFNIFHYPFGSDEARDLNKKIFETMYFAALTESNQLAKEKGTYSHFEGSPVSKGIFQYDMWGLTEDDLTSPFVGKEKWLELKESVKKYGVRNSLLMTNMPTASTSQICGSCETMEPFTSMMYVRKVLSGEYVVLNENLVKDLEKIGLWTDEIKEEILYDQGSIQNIVEIPTTLKEVYKTAFEVRQRDIIQQAAERGPFICQSQSLNLFFSAPDFNKLNSAHFLSWKLGAKTASYYIRSMPASSAQSFGLSSEKISEIKAKREASKGEESYEVCTRVWNPDRMKYEICSSCQ